MVAGLQGACLYDLRSSYAMLYHLDSEAMASICHLLSGKEIGLDRRRDLSDKLSVLVNHGVIRWSDMPGGNAFITEAVQGDAGHTDMCAWIEVTSRCQLACIHCYGRYPKSATHTITGSRVDEIAEQLSLNNFAHVKLIGGEPLLALRETQQWIATLSRHGVRKIELYTNGLRLREEILRYLREYSVRLFITVFGCDETIYRTITGKNGIFQKHLKLFELLNSFHSDYRVSIIRMRQNQMVSTEDVMRTFNIDRRFIREDIVRNVGRASESNLVSKSLRHSSQLRRANFAEPIPSQTIIRNIVGHSCFFNKIYICSDLNVYPCVMERGALYGNLGTTALSDILERSRGTRYLTKDGIETCNACEYRYACFDCRPIRGRGTFTRKPEYCTYDPKSGIWET